MKIKNIIHNGNHYVGLEAYDNNENRFEYDFDGNEVISFVKDAVNSGVIV